MSNRHNKVPGDSSSRFERQVIFILATVQFINVLDFVMVTPLGPDFAMDLDIPMDWLGYISGSYTASAAVAGLLGAFILDKFDRKKSLVFSLVGLTIGTALGGLANDLTTLMIGRIAAGFFGGPVSSLTYAMVADIVPRERRGKALGTIMGAFSVASIVGVPIGLEMSRLGSWRLPFFGIALLGVIVLIAVIKYMPSNLRPESDEEPAAFRFTPTILLSYSLTAAIMISAFMIIPNIASFFQFNLHYPRESLGFLYFVGGLVSLLALPLGGRFVDRYGPFKVVCVGSLLFSASIFIGFYESAAEVSPLLIFVLFTVGMAFRNIPYSTVATSVPKPHERARFMSIQSMTQHLAISFGAVLAAALLDEDPSGALIGMNLVVILVLVIAVLVPCLVWLVEKRLASKC